MKTQYTCQNCGTVHSKWQGQCSGCKQWNTLSEEQTSKKTEHKRYVKNKPVMPITQVRSQEMPRVFSGIPELDCVLGGGLVPGSFVLLSGDPGIGKSTLLTQTLHTLACRGYKVLYASGEESQEQIQAIRNNSGGDRRQMFQEMRTLTQETDNKLKTILDDEQYKIYETFKEKQREQMRSQMQNRRGNRGRF